VDGIEDAIIRRKKITFHYFHLNEKAEREYVTTPTGKRKRYSVEPVALVYNEDNYYLMAYNSKYPGRTASYRIDRIDRLEVVEESTLSDEALAMIDSVTAFTGQAFKMFSGEEKTVTLQFDRSLIDPVLDKFGESTPMSTVDETTCEATVQVQVSPTFFGWLAQFGGKMQVISPENVAEKYNDHIRQITG
jgi:predicted DNA-binding transcriptional regulator YafY